MSESFLFAVNERVVYPGQGVGEIIEISQKKFKEAILNYYVIYFDESDMTVLVPVDKTEELRIRRIVSAQAAEDALSFLSEKFDPIPTDWKMRYQMNLDLFKTGSILDNASIVRSLYHRSKIKELPIQERRLYDSAYRIFYDELSCALEKDKTEVEALVHSFLEPHGGTIAQENSMDDTDDLSLDDDLIFSDDLADEDDD